MAYHSKARAHVRLNHVNYWMAGMAKGFLFKRLGLNDPLNLGFAAFLVVCAGFMFSALINYYA